MKLWKNYEIMKELWNYEKKFKLWKNYYIMIKLWKYNEFCPIGDRWDDCYSWQKWRLENKLLRI